MNQTEKFFNFVTSECTKHQVDFKPISAKYIELSNSIKCSGYFESPNLDKNVPATLAYATEHPDALLILVHEYCHMTQWLDGIPLWKDAEISLELVDSWLEGNDVDFPEKHIQIALELELDNEKRSVELIKRWGLPIDCTKYIQKSNAYLQFYLYLKETRRWSSPEKSPYMIPEIVEAMSQVFDMDYLQLDPRVRQLFINYNI